MYIQRLDPITSNKIAAGEVVERPCAVVKELVENAVDAGSTQIIVEVRQGGKVYIRVTDNGCGIETEDLDLAFERHATSKIHAIEDLDTLHTLGFRGEALASIASVSMVELITRCTDGESGSRVEVQGGKVQDVSVIGAAPGTTIIIRDLFFNTPARLKFLKSNGAELSAITDWISRLAISRPDISFRFIADQQDVFMTTGNGQLREAIAAVFERSLAKSLVDISGSDSGMTIHGFVGDLNTTRSTRQMQLYYVNGRSVKSYLLSEAVETAYHTLLPVNRFPVCFLNIELDGNRLDINIHPAKTQIRFQEEQAVRLAVSRIIRDALLTRDQVPAFRFKPELKPSISASETQVVQNQTSERFISNASIQPSTAIVQPSMRSEIPVEVPNAEKTWYSPTHDLPSVEDNGAVYESVISEDPTIPVQPNLIEMDALLRVPTLAIPSQPEAIQTVTAETLYDHLTIIGQLFRTYIIAEKEDCLYLIDQHAAHEKVLYETFMKQWRSREVTTQLLLMPEVLSLEPAIVQHSEELATLLEPVGFRYDTFGVDAVLVREVPLVAGYPLEPELLRTLLESCGKLLSTGITLETLQAEKIIQDSCKRAIKADDNLELPEIQSLIRQLKTLESPYTCPHGRPIIVRMEKNEIEKRFKRI